MLEIVMVTRISYSFFHDYDQRYTSTKSSFFTLTPLETELVAINRNGESDSYIAQSNWLASQVFLTGLTQ